MVRDLKPGSPEDPPFEWDVVGSEHWTDYDTVMPYTDFEVTLDGENDPVATDQTRYLNGFGTHAQYDIQGEETEYLHGDVIRSTNLTTDGSGDPVSSLAYTAFGEVIGTAPDTRYQYGGGWGYESDLLVLEGAPGTAPVTLQHFGYRWYQPDTGRFIQRDPIGIRGGPNVYAYLGASPTADVDPNGFSRWYVRQAGHSEVWIERPGGGYWVCDFAPAGGKKWKGLLGILPWGTPGGINVVPYGAGGLPDDAELHCTLPSEGAQDLAAILREQASPPRFCIWWSNCLGWAHYWANRRDVPAPPIDDGPRVGPGDVIY